MSFKKSDLLDGDIVTQRNGNKKISKKAIIWGRTGFDGEEVNLA